MLGIVLTILKTIGIVILCILLLVLVLLAIILLVPIKYDVKASYLDKKPNVNCRILWLFKFVNVKVKYCENGLKYSVRVIGKQILPARNKKRKNESSKKKERGQGSGFDNAGVEKAQAYNDNAAAVIEHGSDIESIYEPTQQMDSYVRGSAAEDESIHRFSKSDSPKMSLSERLKRGKKRFKRDTKRLKKKRLAAGKKRTDLKKKWEHIKEIFLTPQMKRAAARLLLDLKKLVRHILPRKLSGWIHFGMSDPASTGEMLARLAVFYPLYSDEFTLEPDFEQQIIEGKASASGRIRLGYIAWIALTIVLDKNIRQQYKLLKAERGKKNG